MITNLAKRLTFTAFYLLFLLWTSGWDRDSFLKTPTTVSPHHTHKPAESVWHEEWLEQTVFELTWQTFIHPLLRIVKWLKLCFHTWKLQEAELHRLGLCKDIELFKNCIWQRNKVWIWIFCSVSFLSYPFLRGDLLYLFIYIKTSKGAA